MYSSGSTGQPKAAIHTHDSVIAGAGNSVAAHELTAEDISLLVLPLYHINAECVTLIPTLLSGGTVVVPQRFGVSRFWDWIDDYRCTWSALVPTIISELVNWQDPENDKRQAALSRIRFFRSSSAPLAPSLHREFVNKFKVPLLQAMGSTEGGNVFSNPAPPRENKIGSPGLPWGFEARIVDRAGMDLPTGQSGEVLIRGRALMRGYYKDQESTDAVLDSEGWLHTGDLAYRDGDGYFYVVGRSKELVIKGGVNIAPRQIDEVLESHPMVLEAAAVGIPDRHLGEDLVAFVVLRAETEMDQDVLLRFCEERLGHFKTPSWIHATKDLPKGPSGKVQRLKLVDLALSVAAEVREKGTSELSGNVPIDALEKVIAATWSELLGTPEGGFKQQLLRARGAFPGSPSNAYRACARNFRFRLRFPTFLKTARLRSKPPWSGNGRSVRIRSSPNWRFPKYRSEIPLHRPRSVRRRNVSGFWNKRTREFRSITKQKQCVSAAN